MQRRLKMEKRHVIDKRNVKLEEMMKKDYIPFGAGRPKRNTVISRDDEANLAIAINTSKSFDDFLGKI
jgi:hypothetical protein